MGIHLHHVAYLALRAVLLGQNDLGFGNARSQLPVSLGDQLEVVALVLRILNGNFYFIESGDKIAKDKVLYLSEEFVEGVFLENGEPLPTGRYYFDAEGKMVID